VSSARASLVDWRASRDVAGMADVEIEECARFCPAMLMSGVAIKPDGVRTVAFSADARSAANERSRSALALRRFSSCVVRLVRGEVEGRLPVTDYSPLDVRSWRRDVTRSRIERWWGCILSFHYFQFSKDVVCNIE
jgi:hypothetical protein